MYLDTGNLRRWMSNLSDDELLSIVTTRRAEYRRVAIDLAAEELMQRDIPLPTSNHPRLNTAPQPTSSQRGSEMKYNHSLLAAGYLLLAGGALFLYVAFYGVSGLNDLSVVGLGAIWLLTLPWSSVLILFAWALVHSDASNPIFLSFFALCAGLNAYLINLVAGAVSRGARYK